ncbi:hypothetical protein QQF64_014254 [Cirrhinus molitorella]|uniref:Uncharacterized protein n=1 Tax=Cirrhinus molitorella TaxID=172907 RepID=A0ABR3NRU8_9TELE
MTEVFFPAESIHTAASSGLVTVTPDQLDIIGITESASVTEDARSSSLTDASETRPKWRRSGPNHPDGEQIALCARRRGRSGWVFWRKPV